MEPSNSSPLKPCEAPPPLLDQPAFQVSSGAETSPPFSSLRTSPGFSRSEQGVGTQETARPHSGAYTDNTTPAALAKGGSYLPAQPSRPAGGAGAVRRRLRPVWAEPIGLGPTTSGQTGTATRSCPLWPPSVGWPGTRGHMCLPPEEDHVGTARRGSRHLRLGVAGRAATGDPPTCCPRRPGARDPGAAN